MTQRPVLHNPHATEPDLDGLVKFECRCGATSPRVLPDTAYGMVLHHRIAVDEGQA